ncbi:MAG: hypothetical protein II656_00175 [Ruminococcus sp.]|nr:hypothetical protein [Ruminococcus sp.]MBQ3946914.1 hypothetical protein [Ruminococcus sp.]
MNRYLSAFIAFSAVLCLSAGCGKKASIASSTLSSETPTAPVSAAEEIITQSDPLAPTTEAPQQQDTTAVVSGAAGSVETTNSQSTETATEEEQQLDPLANSAFSYDESGAVVLKKDISELDEAELLSAGQALFQSACRTEWSYTVGCPYELDNDDFIENDFGWQYHRIITPGISSYSDVLRDYHKVFSDTHEDQLADLYIEKDGAVYALSAARGQDLYYTASKVTSVKERNMNEIVFSVESFYSGSDMSPDTPTSKTNDFSAVIGSDNKLYAGQFVLPY